MKEDKSVSDFFVGLGFNYTFTKILVSLLGSQIYSRIVLENRKKVVNFT